MDNDQKVLGPIQVSQGDIKVTLGTENDQKNIDNAWEEYMKHEINGLVAKDAHTASADEGQRKVSMNASLSIHDLAHRNELISAVSCYRNY